jgi:hypothetical protein
VKRQEPSEQWAARQVEGLPVSWRRRLLSRWEKKRADYNPARVTGEGDALRRANAGLLAALSGIDAAPLPLDASDADICAAADRFTLDCIKAREEAQEYEAGRQRAELAAICTAIGVAPPDARLYQDEGAILRMLCPAWWRRNLRKAQAKAAEGSAIELGYVSRKGGGGECYASDEAVQRRLQQNARNAAMLESTIACNELGQEFTLAELAAKSPANKGVRRAELMTRINGFERVAIDMGHAGMFFTLTCPSRMHAYRTVYGKPVRNRKYDGTRPDQAQKYLTATWALIRAALARRGVKLYGFRIAEPQHDATPHWHLLTFLPAEHMDVLRSVVTHYALRVDGDEPGAAKHRVDFKPMDPAKGTAAGYIAKYVAKNIDGFRLEKDLYGNDSLEASARVEAWATQWRIRQFQQVGGPPVTVWRELRRVQEIPADAPAFVRKAHAAVNRVAVLEGRDNASVAWNHYVEAQGGVFCGRAYRVRLAKIESEQAGRYGDARAAAPVGVEYFTEHKIKDALGNWTGVVPMTVTVESKRFTWEILRPARSAGFAAASITRAASTATSVGAFARDDVVGLDLGFKREHRAPWTRVNNCTQGEKNGRSATQGGRDFEAESAGREGRAGGRGAFAHGQGDGRAPDPAFAPDDYRH